MVSDCDKKYNISDLTMVGHIESAFICKELLKQVVSDCDKKYNISDLTMVGHIESAFIRSEEVSDCDKKCDCFHQK